MSTTFHRLAARAAALFFAFAFTSATLAAVDALAHRDGAAPLAQMSFSVERG